MFTIRCGNQIAGFANSFAIDPVLDMGIRVIASETHKEGYFFWMSEELKYEDKNGETYKAAKIHQKTVLSKCMAYIAKCLGNQDHYIDITDFLLPGLNDV